MRCTVQYVSLNSSIVCTYVDSVCIHLVCVVIAAGTPETVQAILSANALPLLFEGMLRQEEPLVIASARTLCTLYLSGRAPSDVVYEVCVVGYRKFLV